MLTEEKALAVAKYLAEHKDKGEQGLAPMISHALKVSGKEIHKVSRMIQKGLIEFSEEGEPHFVTPYKQIEKYYLKERELEPEEIASKTVKDAVEGAVAEEAAAQTEQYFILGKAVWQAVSNHLIKKGWTIDDIRNKPIHQLIIESLQKADELEPLKQENQELKQQLAYLQGETDPVIRLKKAMKIINEFGTLAIVAEELGFNIDQLIPYYESLISSYLKGVNNA